MKDLKRTIRFGNKTIVNFVNLVKKDQELVRRLRHSSKIRKYMYSGKYISRKEHFLFIDKLKNDNKNYYWLVKCSDNEYIGVIYLNRLDLNNKHAYLGIYADNNSPLTHKGNRLMDCLKYISFDLLKLHTLKLEVLKDNLGAITFYKKEGFNQEGVLKEFIYKENKWQAVIVMGLISNRDRSKMR